MSESTKIVEFCQNASNNELVENSRIEAIGDQSNDEIGVSLMPDVANCEVDSKIINEQKSESEHQFGCSATTGMSAMNGTNGMRQNDTELADVCDHSDQSQDDDTEDGVDDMPEDLTHDGITNLNNGSNHQIVIETVIEQDSNGLTIVNESTVNTNHSVDNSLNQSLNNTTSDQTIENNNSINSESQDMTTRPKQLKSLLKKVLKESTKINKEKKNVKFSETMQVFCDDWPQNLMPQIIALKSPTDFNLVEVQGYMFEPPVEYQDFLPFEPPPDYRDLIASSLCAYDNDLSINYIDDEDDDNTLINNSTTNDHKFINEFSSKWESMILNNSEVLEEEQIIGVLKEDAILQAIGSHISLPEEQLCQEDFPIHFHNKFNSNDCVEKLAESELSDINSEDGNDSSPTGSLQDIDIASDSSITSQDTIILMTNDNSFDNSNKEPVNQFSDSLCATQTITDDSLTKVDSIDGQAKNEINAETSESSKSVQSIEANVESETVEEVDKTTDVETTDRKELQTSDTTEKSEPNDYKKPSDRESNDERKAVNLFSDESNAMQLSHTNAFKRNLMFYENMLLDNNKTETNNKLNRPLKQSHTVNHFITQNNSKFPIFTNVIKSEKSSNENNSDLEVKQCKTSDGNYGAINTSSQLLQSRPPTIQTQPNHNNWSTDEFIIEYTSEPRALVPSKRTASLSSFTQIAPNQQMPVRNHINSNNNNNNNNNNYLSLNRKGETQQQWKLFNNNNNNSQQQVRYQYPPNQRPVSPNPRPISPQQLFHYNRPQFNPRFHSSSQPMPSQVMYIRSQYPPPVQRVSARFPVSSGTMPSLHKPAPPPYHYHIQQHNNEFPNPSEIRRRDGLNAYPHVLQQTPQAGALPVPPIHHNTSQHNSQTLSKDELEQFVQQDIQRTERIKKRYSMTEEDDPSFGFARRPSVRGIRPKYGSTNEILKQMQSSTNCPLVSSQMTGNHVSWPQTSSNNNNQSLQKEPQLVQIRVSQQQKPINVKHTNELQNEDTSQPQSQSSQPLPQHSRTLPRPSSLISHSQMKTMRTEDRFVIQMFANSNNISGDQLKQQIERQIEQQLQPKLHKKMTSMSSINVKPVLSSNDERGAPEGASSSPKHSSDLLFAKNINTTLTNSVETSELTDKQTNDTKKLVIVEETNTTINANNKLSQDNEGVIYYSMNV